MYSKIIKIFITVKYLNLNLLFFFFQAHQLEVETFLNKHKLMCFLFHKLLLALATMW